MQYDNFVIFNSPPVHLDPVSNAPAFLMNDQDIAAKPHIAIVDDDPVMRSLLVRLLSISGFSTVTFDSGESFLREQPLNPSICVLLDLSMPGLSGFEVRDRLAKSDPGVPVILITGETDPTLGTIAREKGFAACLPKPVNPALLLLSILQALQWN